MAQNEQKRSEAEIKLDTELSNGFDRGNYAGAYETNAGLDRALRRAAGKSEAYRHALVLGYYSSFELHEIPSSARERFDEAYSSPAGRRVVELGYTESRDDDYAEEME